MTTWTNFNLKIWKNLLENVTFERIGQQMDQVKWGKLGNFYPYWIDETFVSYQIASA